MDKNEITTLKIEVAPAQMKALQAMSEHTGVTIESLAQAAFDFGLEPMDWINQINKPSLVCVDEPDQNT